MKSVAALRVQRLQQRKPHLANSARSAKLTSAILHLIHKIILTFNEGGVSSPSVYTLLNLTYLNMKETQETSSGQEPEPTEPLTLEAYIRKIRAFFTGSFPDLNWEVQILPIIIGIFREEEDLNIANLNIRVFDAINSEKFGILREKTPDSVVRAAKVTLGA